MNPNAVASAITGSFEAQLTAHIAGGFSIGPVLASLTPEQLAAVREIVTQAARNVATSIACDVDEALEGRAAA